MNYEIKQVYLSRFENITNISKIYSYYGYEFVNSNTTNNNTIAVFRRKTNLVYYDAFKDIELETTKLRALKDKINSSKTSQNIDIENKNTTLKKVISYISFFVSFFFLLLGITLLNNDTPLGVMLILLGIGAIVAGFYLYKLLKKKPLNTEAIEAFITSRTNKLNKIAERLPKTEKDV